MISPLLQHRQMICGRTLKKQQRRKEEEAEITRGNSKEVSHFDRQRQRPKINQIHGIHKQPTERTNKQTPAAANYKINVKRRWIV